MVCQQKQVLALRSLTRHQQTIYLSTACLIGRDIIRHLDTLQNLITLTHDEITFANSLSEVIDIPPLVLTLPD